MHQIALFLKLMFSLNKNLFFERLSFLKTKSAKVNTIGYGIWFVLKDHVISWGCLFLMLKILNHGGFAFCLICALLFVKLFRIDNIDWRLYFRNDFCLAFPESKERFFTVLSGNIVKSLLFEDFTPLYILPLVLFTPLGIWSALALYVFFVALFVFVLTYYFLLETGSLRIKKIYSFISYIFSMSSTFLIIYFLLNVIISLMTGIDFTTFKENPMMVFDTVTADATMAADKIKNAIISYEWWWVLIIASLVLFAPIVYIVFNHKDVLEEYDDCNLIVPRWLTKHNHLFCKTPFEKALFVKEAQLFSYLYRCNFKQYWFSVFFDRSISTTLAIWLALYQSSVPNASLIFFCFALIMMTLDISSQVGVKMITNLSFVSDFNTLRTANTNGLDLKDIIKAKLSFFYSVRLLPSALSVVIYALCLLSLNAPAYTVLFLVISCVLILWLYPIVYFTNNLINTKMDYRDYEKYLEESKILDFGVEDFLPLGITYKVKIVLLLACVVAAVLLTDISWLYPAVTVLIAFLSIIDHLIMKRVLRNILSFIQGGEYSADIKKIFNTSDSSR